METKKIKFGILGFGSFAERRLIPGFKFCEKAELTAISKRNFSEAKEKAEKYSIPKAYTSIESILLNEEIQAVFIASPNSLHKEHTILAAKAGKHVLVEKPMALNSTNCKEMIDVCDQNGVKLMIAQCMRFNSTILRIKELIQTQQLGDIVSMDCSFLFDAKQSERKWIFSHDIAGGGPIMDLGVHCLDNLRFLAESEVKKVSGQKEYNLTPEVESKAHFTLEFEKPIIANVRVGFEGNYYSSIEVVGTKAIARAEMFNLVGNVVELRIWENRKLTIEYIQNSDCYAAEIDAFSNSILNGIEPPIPGIEGLKNQLILDQIL